MGKDRPYVTHAISLFRLHPEVREVVRQHTTTQKHALVLLRLKPYQHLALTEKMMEEG